VITGLSKRRELVNLRSFPPKPHNIAELIEMHCEADTKKVGSQVPIHKITKLSMKVIFLFIGRITGSTTLHQACWAHMYYAMQCLNARVFDWSMTMIDYMKRQLIEFRGWSKKTLGLVPFSALSSSRGYPALVRERWCRGMWPLSQLCVDGKHCYRDRGEEGP